MLQRGKSTLTQVKTRNVSDAAQQFRRQRYGSTGSAVRKIRLSRSSGPIRGVFRRVQAASERSAVELQALISKAWQL
jgi:hypothetical protein